MNNYRARYYDPKAGRFITKDPLGFDGGDVNLYAYVGNNPVNYTDPLGLSAPCCDGYWQGVDAKIIFNAICYCRWLCISPYGSIWSGDPSNLPTTRGIIINGSKNPKSGDACMCKDPRGYGRIVPLTTVN